MSPRIAILGDIHGNLEALQAVLQDAKLQGVTHYVCAGDLVGYNASPLECMNEIQKLNPIAIVRGNHDEYSGNVQQDLELFNPIARKAILWTRRQLSKEQQTWLATLPLVLHIPIPEHPEIPAFQVVHGTLENPALWGYVNNRFSARNCMQLQSIHQICFIAHTHTAVLFKMKMQENTDDAIGIRWPDGENGCSAFFNLEDECHYLINVGSVGQPRDGNPNAAYVLYLPVERQVQLRRVPYDIASCQRRILDAGLPSELADRLAEGR